MASSCHCPGRVTLGVMAFLMFLVTQMIRNNLNIAIVAIEDVYQQKTNHSSSINESAKWSEHSKGVLLGAFYWSYWITELPGGLLAQRFGSQRVLSVGVGVAGVLNFLLPLSCNLHAWAAAGIRALQGLALGVTWPAMHSISTHWIPAHERGKFMTAYHGAAVGNAVCYPLSGLLIASFGWELMFHLIGVLSLLWVAAWSLLVYDSPSQHPRLDSVEREYLEKELGKSLTSKRTKAPIRTPWLEILCSIPFWAVVLASIGAMWGTITLTMQTPSYFKTVHSLDIKTNGLVSGMPDMFKFLFGLLFSSLMDHLLKHHCLSITIIRKISTCVCEFFPAILLIILAYAGPHSTTAAIALLTLTVVMGGANSSANLSNIVDISPNFAGTILGLIKTLVLIPGVLSPLIASIIKTNNDTLTSWQLIFVLTATIYILCCIVFIIFGSGEIQPWNELQEEPTIELHNLMDNNYEKGRNNSKIVKN